MEGGKEGDRAFRIEGEFREGTGWGRRYKGSSWRRRDWRW